MFFFFFDILQIRLNKVGLVHAYHWACTLFLNTYFGKISPICLFIHSLIQQTFTEILFCPRQSDGRNAVYAFKELAKNVLETGKYTNICTAAAAKSLQSWLTLRPRRRQPTRLRHPWDSPGKIEGQRQYRYIPNITETRGRKAGEPEEGFIGEAVLYQDVKNEHKCLPGGHSKTGQSTKARRHEALKENQ